jgi:hypothetical protein
MCGNEPKSVYGVKTEVFAGTVTGILKIISYITKRNGKNMIVWEEYV